MTAISKPRALLRGMSERQGLKITARDVAALRLAIATMEAQEDRRKKQEEMHSNIIRVYGDTLSDMVTQKAKSDALIEGLRVLLEVHT